MRGTIIKRSKTSWAIVIDHGRDPITKKRKQRWIKFQLDPSKNTRENMTLANAKLAELLHQLDRGTYVDASKVTLIEYLRDWHKKNVVPHRRPETARIYQTMIESHVAKAPIAMMPLQKVRTSDIEAFYGTVTLSPRSINVLHAVIGRAMKIAVRDKVLVANPAAAVDDRPKPPKGQSQAARIHCWTTSEVRAVMAAAKKAGPQPSAFFSVLLDTGCRKSEALGLVWSDIDLEKATLTIARQLEPRCSERPKWGPTKTKTVRDVSLTAETVTRLRAHRKAQRELMMANRTTYEDHGLVFAKEPGDVQNPTAALGQPCRALENRYFKAVVKAAGVRLIKVHGTRHTVATLMLETDPPHVVAARLGHSVMELMETYAHAMPTQQRAAANTHGGRLGG